ncbi:hypothetical protein [Litchfieldella xinjiangensis]|uniref:hypothetical protein n=1 Tax=Litchfieldella xinjiangensis TaxID=1166948 RepID=UPI0005BDF85C|nr:hypothetical protein [Halomonas xinjiangensis]
MAITPWGVPRYFSLSEAAYLMAGVELWTVEADFVPLKEEQTAKECKIMLFEAARRGEVEPFFDEVPEEDWRLHPIDEVRLTFERAEIYRWLRELGYADNDINEDLRVPRKPQSQAEQQDKPINARRRQTYLKLIEGLALEVLGGEIPAEPYKAAAVLQAVLARHALKLDDEPIAKIVKEIQAAREERNSDPFDAT